MVIDLGQLTAAAVAAAVVVIILILDVVGADAAGTARVGAEVFAREAAVCAVVETGAFATRVSLAR